MQQLTRFGPSVGIFAVACLLVVIFSGAFAQLIVQLSPWSRPRTEPGQASASVAARWLALILMPVSYGSIDGENLVFFMALAIGCALSQFCLVTRFRQLRRAHTHRVQRLQPDGRPARDKDGRILQQVLPVGREADLYEQVREDWHRARAAHPGLLLGEFMQASGVSRNKPQTLWPPDVLHGIASRLETLAVLAILCGTGAIFLGVLLMQAMPYRL